MLILVPSVWEERLTTRFCEDRNIRDCYVAVESRAALERRDLRLWCCTSWVIGSSFFSLNGVISRASPGGRCLPGLQERKRASIPVPGRMAQSAPAFGMSPSEKRTLDLITDHPMIPREHMATWLGVSEGRVSQMMRSLVSTWDLIERHGKRGDVRYTLSNEGIRYVTHRDRAELPTTQGIWSTALTVDKQGRRRHVGHRIETWARQTKHADGITWFLSKLGGPRPGPTPTANSNGRFPPPGQTGPTIGGIRPSPLTPLGTFSLVAFTCRSTSSTSCEPVTPGASWPA